MKKIIKIIIVFIFLFVIGIFYIGLTRDTNYNTSSLINKETPEFKIISFDNSNFYTRDDIKKKIIIHLLIFGHHGVLLVKLNILY